MAFKESHPMPSTANIYGAVNARQSGKFDEMVGKSVYSVNYKFPDCNIEVRVLPVWLFHYLRIFFYFGVGGYAEISSFCAIVHRFGFEFF